MLFSPFSGLSTELIEKVLSFVDFYHRSKNARPIISKCQQAYTFGFALSTGAAFAPANLLDQPCDIPS